jgi:phage RecT family recombinase
MSDQQAETVDANTGEVMVVPRWKQAIIGARERFVAIASHDQMVDWARESMFALQALERNEYLRDIAENNPGSLRNAIINVAACGITLNPVSQYAALVPRDGAVCLDVMYRGFIKIATDAGSIRFAKAEIVHEADTFLYRGPVAAPDHHADPFRKDRGAIVGVYCVAKTADGDFLTEVMPVADIEGIRDRSPAWMKGKKGPWLTDFGEMAKKVVIKRARKTWPETKNERAAQRLQLAAELANAADGFTNGLPALEHIGPTAGVAESIPAEIREGLIEFAANAEETFRKDGAEATNEYIASLGLDVDQQTFLWSRLDSKTRTAARKAAGYGEKRDGHYGEART